MAKTRKKDDIPEDIREVLEKNPSPPRVRYPMVHITTHDHDGDASAEDIRGNATHIAFATPVFILSRMTFKELDKCLVGTERKLLTAMQAIPNHETLTFWLGRGYRGTNEEKRILTPSASASKMLFTAALRWGRQQICAVGVKDKDLEALQSDLQLAELTSLGVTCLKKSQRRSAQGTGERLPYNDQL